MFVKLMDFLFLSTFLHAMREYGVTNENIFIFRKIKKIYLQWIRTIEKFFTSIKKIN